jgi:hypothetical protein
MDMVIGRVDVATGPSRVKGWLGVCEAHRVSAVAILECSVQTLHPITLNSITGYLQPQKRLLGDLRYFCFVPVAHSGSNRRAGRSACVANSSFNVQP